MTITTKELSESDEAECRRVAGADAAERRLKLNELLAVQAEAAAGTEKAEWAHAMIKRVGGLLDERFARERMGRR